MDPYTYPGRPWPLSTLTIRLTDHYLRKSFRLLQNQLAPETVLFLGDMFDGGREWSTSPGSGTESKSAEKRWNRYGDKFWFQEYNRFSRIFLDSWVHGVDATRDYQRGRKLIAELPGNHDLGFGIGIRLPVRKRFNAYFGAGNRVDVIGNHTFVSVDTVSLSANGQLDPATGSQGSHSGDERVQKIWDTTETFLSEVKDLKARMINQELRFQAGLPEYEPQDHHVHELHSAPLQEKEIILGNNTDVPSILLTHVPLYRGPGTLCGPLRERYPPSQVDTGASGEPPKDDRNALPVGAGVQYQTVLTPAISSEVVEKVGDVEFVFSGDDHDYCDVIHRGYTSKNGGIREITVKAMSWAAGIRKPGFLMLSLWNPINDEGVATKPGPKDQTLHTHLCLLPDQLSIFTRYVILFVITLFILLIRAFTTIYRRPTTLNSNPSSSILPITNPDTQPTTSSSALHSHNSLAPRPSATTRARSTSPLNDYGYANDIPPSSSSAYPDLGSSGKHRGRIGAVWREWVRKVGLVAGVVILWYFWLLWDS